MPPETTVPSTFSRAVRRYDRTPKLELIHQEDRCQATGSAAGWKYECEGGPSLKNFADVLRDFGTIDDRELLRKSPSTS